MRKEFLIIPFYLGPVLSMQIPCFHQCIGGPGLVGSSRRAPELTSDLFWFIQDAEDRHTSKPHWILASLLCSLAFCITLGRTTGGGDTPRRLLPLGYGCPGGHVSMVKSGGLSKNTGIVKRPVWIASGKTFHEKQWHLNPVVYCSSVTWVPVRIAWHQDIKQYSTCHGYRCYFYK